MSQGPFIPWSTRSVAWSHILTGQIGANYHSTVASQEQTQMFPSKSECMRVSEPPDERVS